MKTTIFIADIYRKGCPSNTVGRCAGIGFTPKQAVTHCRPWNNQAPYLTTRTRSICLVDGQGSGEEVWSVLGLPTGFETGAHADAIKAAEIKAWSAPQTIARLEREALRAGESAGQVIDRLAAALA